MHVPSLAAKEKTIDKQEMYESGIRYFQASAKDFTPVTVSADFAALERPKCSGDTEKSVWGMEREKTGAGMASTPLNHNKEGVFLITVLY